MGSQNFLENSSKVKSHIVQNGKNVFLVVFFCNAITLGYEY